VLAGATLRLAIVAPPGVGKTRLATEFLQHAAWKGCRVLQGHGADEGAARRCSRWCRCCAAHWASRRRRPQEAQRGAGPAAGRALGVPGLACTAAPAAGPARGRRRAPARRRCVAAALATLFEALAARQPLLLFVDDWQWADASTRQWLSDAGPRHAGPAAAGAGHRARHRRRRRRTAGLQVLDLAPFSAAETTDSVQHLLPQADPFIAAEICLYRRQPAVRGRAVPLGRRMDDPERWLVRRLGGGNWLNVLVESRVARLPPGAGRPGAAGGGDRPVIPPGPAAVQLSGRAADDPALLALADEDLLFADADGGHRFKHGLTRDVIYESVGLHLRRAAAPAGGPGAAGAQRWTADPPHEALAYHYRGAGRPADAARHAEAAGDRRPPSRCWTGRAPCTTWR
jgi:hypothetical protein